MHAAKRIARYTFIVFVVLAAACGVASIRPAEDDIGTLQADNWAKLHGVSCWLPPSHLCPVYLYDPLSCRIRGSIVLPTANVLTNNALLRMRCVRAHCSPNLSTWARTSSRTAARPGDSFSRARAWAALSHSCIPYHPNTPFTTRFVISHDILACFESSLFPLDGPRTRRRTTKQHIDVIETRSRFTRPIENNGAHVRLQPVDIMFAVHIASNAQRHRHERVVVVVVVDECTHAAIGMTMAALPDRQPRTANAQEVEARLRDAERQEKTQYNADLKRQADQQREERARNPVNQGRSSAHVVLDPILIRIAVHKSAGRNIDGSLRQSERQQQMDYNKELQQQAQVQRMKQLKDEMEFGMSSTPYNKTKLELGAAAGKPPPTINPDFFRSSPVPRNGIRGSAGWLGDPTQSQTPTQQPLNPNTFNSVAHSAPQRPNVPPPDYTPGIGSSFGSAPPRPQQGRQGKRMRVYEKP
ncbi:unnamed protein product [Sphagnum balticum]